MKTEANILITGASTGIGRATAIEFARRGYHVFAGVRKEEDQKSLLSEKVSGLEPILLDVTKAADIERTTQMLQQRLAGRGLFALINNAGINYVAPFELADERKIRELMEVNFFGMVNLSRALLPVLQDYAQLHPGKGAKIINVGSIGSALGIPWEFSYHASKFAVLGMSQSLRFELEPLGIRVSCVMPGGVRTPFFDKSGAESQQASLKAEGRNKDYYARNANLMWETTQNFERFATPPETVASRIYRALEQKNPPLKILVGADARVLHFLVWAGWSGLLKRQFVRA